MAKLIQTSFKGDDGKVIFHTVKAFRLFEHGGFHLALHRPVSAKSGRARSKGWTVTELTSGMAMGYGYDGDTADDAMQLCRDRIDQAEKFSKGQLAHNIAQAVARDGRANDPANLPTAKASAASEYRAALARVLEILDHAGRITEMDFGSDIAAWRALVEG